MADKSPGQPLDDDQSVEEGVDEDDPKTKAEFEDFKAWLDAGSPASKVPSQPSMPAPKPPTPQCNACGRSPCDLVMFYYVVLICLVSFGMCR